MKKIKLVLCICFISLFMAGASILQADWDYAAGGYFSNIQFAGNDGWVTDNYGRIHHSPDGGTTWEIQESGFTERLYGISFINSTTGWITGDEGIILHTTDGGMNWTPQTSGTTDRLESVYFLDALNGWAGGRYGTFVKTTDGGSTWTPVTVTDKSNQPY